jgi:type VI secretion system protein ImpA
MSDLDEAQALVSAWLQPLADESAPCGPDFEYEAEFLALTQAAAGKPETQFGPGEPPDWRGVHKHAESLLERSRDLRVAIFWLRSSLALQGYSALLPGLRLITGLLSQLWDHVHPLPDPDDADPYARVNALAVMSSGEGLIGDLRTCAVVRDRAIGQVLGREVEIACGLSQAVGDESDPGKESISRMFAAVIERDAALRDHALACVDAVAELRSTVDDRFGSWETPDLAPLAAFVKGVASLMPSAAAAGDGDDADSVEGDGSGADRGGHGDGGRGLSGAVRSREEALRAIDMVCEFLERTEPSNPAPLFLRRAQQLVNHNFLQLMKELAPTLMPDVARIVGIDPDSV